MKDLLCDFSYILLVNREYSDATAISFYLLGLWLAPTGFFDSDSEKIVDWSTGPGLAFLMANCF